MARGRKKAGPAAEVRIDQAFFNYLNSFYRANRASIRQHYKQLTRRFLDWNDAELRPDAFLRKPQFEALEMYVFLKEYTGNAPVFEIFDRWYHRGEGFGKRSDLGLTVDGDTQLTLLPVEDAFNEAAYQTLYARMKAYSLVDAQANRPKWPNPPPNYIFALTMGTGKTILMATCLLYEFLLSNKFPQDPRFAHNALVFAPDKTVLESLREIESFGHHKVLPPEYAKLIAPVLRFHVLADGDSSLQTMDGSKFNIVISNAQKIILKRQHRQRTPMELLMHSGPKTYKPSGNFARAAELDDEVENEEELTVNQRFQKLCRLGQLAIFIDEAHHAFGKNLAGDLGQDPKNETAFRRTVKALIDELEAKKTRVVGTFCYTGTPYAGGELFPDVVYAYGLKEAVDRGLLKKLHVTTFEKTEPDTTEFVDLVIDDFMEHFGRKRFEGMLPKLAIFASRLEEVANELRPAVEMALARHGVPASRIVVNVGDDKQTSTDDLREFNRLDRPESEKQFILLVGKGKEGWNCRSLFGVALYKKPKSKIFVLQATMRCLRQIDAPHQHTGHVYISEENREILDAELQQNFKLSLSEVSHSGSKKRTVEVRPLPPPRKIKFRRSSHRFKLERKEIVAGVEFAFGVGELAVAPLDEKYHILRKDQDDVRGTAGWYETETVEVIHRVQQVFSPFTLCAEIARYLHYSPIEVEAIMATTKEGLSATTEWVNRYNELLYDVVIPKLFGAIYTQTSEKLTEEIEVDLVKLPDGDRDHYSVSANPDMIVEPKTPGVGRDAAKSFHLSHYCFDSKPEYRFFFDLLKDGRVKELYFTGMLTHGQSDFFIDYIDPELHTVRSYYPDFLIRKADDSWLIVEVKGDDQIDDPVVDAKKRHATELADDSKMRYEIIKSSVVMAGGSTGVLA